jgi:hypothetical protein
MQELFYGNPLLYQKEIMSSQALNVLMNKIKTENPQIWNAWVSSFPPQSNSEIVEEDLLSMIAEIEKQTPSDVTFVNEAEDDKEKLFIKLMKEKDIEISEDELKKITYYLDPITMWLKYHFNYPRPYQVAYFRSVPMYPSQSTNANSPSYPSGHSIDSLCIGVILSKRFPEHKEAIMSLAYRISMSRYISGIHFSFDKSFGESIGIYIGENYSEFLTEISRG